MNRLLAHREDPAPAARIGASKGDAALFLAVAAALLALTLAWHIPMMLHDHLDLVPIRDAFIAGTAGYGQLLDVHHGSHLHATAYVVLLATTELSGGRTWLDCVVSWCLLLVYAAVVLRGYEPPAGTRARWRIVLVFFALFPGHLANLQWGWQVAVFLCLAGVALAIHALTREALSWPLNLAALLAAALAALSFSTGIALLPVALLLILARDRLAPAARAWFALPWMLLLLVLMRHLGTDAPIRLADLREVCHYALNFLGSGVSRFADDAAPWLAALALVFALPTAWRARRLRPAWPWLAWMAFAVGSSVLVAIGRVDAYGSDHAFASRYVSFSSTFWLGWCGLLATAGRPAKPRVAAAYAALVVVVLTAAVFNAAHLAKNARSTGAEAAAIASRIRATYPDVDEGLLQKIYFGDAKAARSRLDRLHATSAAPFDE